MQVSLVEGQLEIKKTRWSEKLVISPRKNILDISAQCSFDKLSFTGSLKIKEGELNYIDFPTCKDMLGLQISIRSYIFEFDSKISFGKRHCFQDRQ